MRDYWQELKTVIILAMPLMLGQLAQTGMGFVDTVIAGQVSAEDLAGVALGSAVWLPIYLFASGILLVLTPKVAYARGEGSTEEVASYLKHAVILAMGLGIVGSLLLLSAPIWLGFLTLSDQVFVISRDYLFALAMGLFIALLFQTIRFFHEGHGLTRLSMWLSFAGFIINIPLNYLFVYGWGVIPAMGGAGCGVATTLSYVLMALLGWLWFFLRQDYAGYWQFYRISMVGHQVMTLFRLGLPIASSILFEVGLFIFIAFLVTPLGTVVLAAHQVAISYTSMVFMLPLSMAMALTVRIGFLAGQGDRVALKRSVVVMLVFGLLLGSIIALLTLMFADVVAHFYSDDPQVIEIALTLIVLAGLYQVSDAIQVICAGILRGLVDTVTMMWITFFAYWVLALPVGYWLCYEWDYGVEGFWISFIVGLSVAAIGLLWRVWWRVWRKV